MIRAIIWKEWRKTRLLFLGFVLAAILLPAFPGQFFPNEGETARAMMRFIWIIFCLFGGWFFHEQRGRGTIPFSLARPATKPYLFGVQHLSYLIIFGALVVITLSVHYIHMCFRFPVLSLLDILLEPKLLFGLVLCLFFLSLSLFVAQSIITFGTTIVGIAFAVMLTLLLIFSRQVAALAAQLPWLGPRLAPLTYIALLLCGIAFFGTLSLWETSFDEMRDAKNRRWTRGLASATILSIILIGVAIYSICRTRVKPSKMTVNEVFSTFQSSYPVTCSLSDGSDQDRLVAISSSPYYVGGRFVKKEADPPPFIRDLHVSGKNFIPVPFDRGKYRKTYVYYSEKPILGAEIRRAGVGIGLSRGWRYGGYRDDIDTVVLSPRYYSRKETLGLPFLSPDNDRVAYLRTSRSRFGGKVSRSLWITKFGQYIHSPTISDHAELPGDAGTDRQPIGWTPIGWTPGGYNFLLGRTGPDGPETWAVDWVARGPQRFLEEFPGAIITGDDLPRRAERRGRHRGKWISAVRKTDTGTWELWGVNYRSGEKQKLDEFKNQPVRAWGMSGLNVNARKTLGVSDSSDLLVCFDGSNEIILYEIGDTIQRVKSFPVPMQVSHMKVPSSSPMVAIVGTAPADVGKRTSLSILIITGRVIMLVDDFPATERQWGWLSDAHVICYASGSELWQVEMDGTRTRILP